MKYNYAQVNIKQSEKDPTQIEIGTRVVTLGNHALLTKDFTVMTNQARKAGNRIKYQEGYISLDFDKHRTRYPKMCRQTHS